eukprot:1191445-Prorocentrum_minimum.AAC.2
MHGGECGVLLTLAFAGPSGQEETLKAEAKKGGIDAVGAYLRERGVAAYRQKQAEIEAVEEGLMPQVRGSRGGLEGV